MVEEAWPNTRPATRRRWHGRAAASAIGSLLVGAIVGCTTARIALAQAPDPLPEWRLYSAYFRDLPQMHPDFEAPYAADYAQTGLLMPNLNAQMRPAFMLPARRSSNQLQSQWIDYNVWPSPPTLNASSNTAIANQGHFFFDEYYTDVPGINIGYNITLNFTLDDPAKATYKWIKPQFFPLDGKGFGIKEAYTITDPALPAEMRDGVPRNFWFTTQMDMTFYYRGGEVFNFSGDDDLWVFVDGNLTSCDVGGIHQTRGCALDLDSLGMQINTSHTMTVFHAERHADASYFAVTTSVKPVNRPPVAGNLTVTTRADMDYSFMLPGADPDNDKLTYYLLDPPTLGAVVANSTGSPLVKYRAGPEVVGTDTFSFTAFDGVVNATTAGWITVNVLPRKRAPVPHPVTFNVTVGETTYFPLIADAPDTPAAQLTWEVTSNPKYGYATVAPADGELGPRLKYEAINAGADERFTIRVVDPDGFVGTGDVTGIVNAKAVVIIGGLTPPVVAGIVLGSVGAAGMIGTGAAYVLYNRYLAAKFAATWQEEWMRSNVNSNPLFVSNVKEQFNPLYQS